MGLLGRLFGSSKPRDPVAAAAIKAWVLSALGEKDIEVTVSEIVCNDLSCPGTETIVLVLRPGQPTKALKFSEPMDSVRQQHVTRALQEQGLRPEI